MHGLILAGSQSYEPHIEFMTIAERNCHRIRNLATFLLSASARPRVASGRCKPFSTRCPRIAVWHLSRSCISPQSTKAIWRPSCSSAPRCRSRRSTSRCRSLPNHCLRHSSEQTPLHAGQPAATGGSAAACRKTHCYRPVLSHALRRLRSRAIAIVLSGTEFGRRIGIKHIKEQGGLTIAQDPTEAEFDSMPRSAIATGMVDWVSPVAEIPTRLMALMRNEVRMHVPPEVTSQAGEEAEENGNAGGPLTIQQKPRRLG